MLDSCILLCGWSKLLSDHADSENTLFSSLAVPVLCECTVCSTGWTFVLPPGKKKSGGEKGKAELEKRKEKGRGKKKKNKKEKRERGRKIKRNVLKKGKRKKEDKGKLEGKKEGKRK